MTGSGLVQGSPRGGDERAVPALVSASRQTKVVVFALLVLLLALLPLVGHGCHGDDVDHEPSVPPPVYNHP